MSSPASSSHAGDTRLSIPEFDEIYELLDEVRHDAALITFVLSAQDAKGGTDDSDHEWSTVLREALTGRAVAIGEAAIRAAGILKNAAPSRSD